MQNTNARIFAYPNISFANPSNLGHLASHTCDDDSRRDGHAAAEAARPKLRINKVYSHKCLLILSNFKSLVIP